MAGQGVALAVKDAARVASGLALVLSQPLPRERALQSLAAASASLPPFLPSSAAAAFEAARGLLATKLGVSGRGNTATPPPADASSAITTSHSSHNLSHSSLHNQSPSPSHSDSLGQSGSSHSTKGQGFSSSSDAPAAARTLELPSVDSTWKPSARQADVTSSRGASSETAGSRTQSQAGSHSHGASSLEFSAATGHSQTPSEAQGTTSTSTSSTCSTSSTSNISNISSSSPTESTTSSITSTIGRSPAESSSSGSSGSSSADATPRAEAPQAAASGADGGDTAPGPVRAEAPRAAEQSRGPGRATRVPATQAGRIMGFVGLGASLAFGAGQEAARRLWQGTGPSPESGSGGGASGGGGAYYSAFLTESNAERLAAALCRMRGAALKLGQMLSIQDEALIPPQVLAALERVRQGADVMPQAQLSKVLAGELGPEWRGRFEHFEMEPMAAASIGQVHKARTAAGEEVAVKLQYPGVADSIESDLDNLALLLSYTALLPQQLYMDQAMKVAKVELAQECDYARELESQELFAHKLRGYESERGRDWGLGRAPEADGVRVYVPRVYPELSTRRVITTEFVQGIPIDQVARLSQSERDAVGRKIFQITLLELFRFRFMQTDPNWGNFLYDPETRTLNLIDFGAARAYPKSFVDSYIQMVRACADRDRSGVLEHSQALGFLTGEESRVMMDAHVEAGYAVGLPFSRQGGFDFGANDITRRVTRLGSTLVQHRLTAPPEDAYSLHRKLSGCFLACIKLRATVPCREDFLRIYEEYDFGPEPESAAHEASAAPGAPSLALQ